MYAYNVEPNQYGFGYTATTLRNAGLDPKTRVLGHKALSNWSIAAARPSKACA